VSTGVGVSVGASVVVGTCVVPGEFVATIEGHNISNPFVGHVISPSNPAILGVIVTPD
jgi:hypothetical protein